MLKTFLAFFVGGLILCTNALADDPWQKLQGPYGGIVNPLAIDQNNHLYAVFNNTISKSTDQGLTWTPLSKNIVTFKIGADERIYAESINRRLYYSVDWGANWIALPQNLSGLRLAKIAISSNGTLYFAGDDKIYLSNNQGNQWTILPAVPNNGADRIWLGNADNLFFIKGNQLYSVDAEFTVELLLAAEGEIRTVFESSKNEIFVSVENGATDVVLKSTDAGVTWDATSLPFVHSFYESPQGWLFGAGAAPGYLASGTSFVTATNGNSWTPIDFGLPVYGFAVTSDGKIFAASDGLFFSTNNAVSFQNISSAHPTVYKVLNPSPDQLFCVTGIDKKFCRFWYSSTDGASWTEINKKSVFNQPATFIDAKLVRRNLIWLLLGYSASGDSTIIKSTLYESRDGGQSWRANRDFDNRAGFDFDKSLSTVYLWARGEKYFYRTDDFGAAWIPTTLPFQVGDMFAASDGLVYAYAQADAGKIRQLWHSLNKGDKWQSVDIPFSDTGVARMAVDRFGHVYKLTANQQDESTFTLSSVIRSADYGQNFVGVTPDSGSVLQASEKMYCLSTDPNGALYVTGSHFIAASRDNGHAWQDIWSPLSQNAKVRCVHTNNGMDVYVGTFSDGIYKTVYSPLKFIPELIDGIESPIAATFGINWIDYDADGYDDIFLANDGQNLLYKNNKDGTFKRITSGSLVTDIEPSRSASWADYNNDGYLDCFVANGTKEIYNSLYKNNRDGTFSKITEGNIVEDYGDYRSCAWADVDNDSDLDLYVTEVSEEYPNILYINDGTNHFTKSTDIVVGERAERTYNCGWCDFDDDGDLDIYLANQGPDKLYEQVRRGEFSLVGADRIEPNQGSAVSCSWGDYNNDGFMDLFVVNYDMPNCLYRNNGDGSLTKVNAPGISTDNKISKGSGWADYDNDGDLDLFVSNRNSYLFYTNDGEGNFEKASTQDFYYHAGNSLSVAWGDRENDGDLDLVISSYDQQTMLYRNITTGNNWLKIICVGNKSSNRSGLGAKIKIKTTVDNKAHRQVRHVMSQTSHAAQNSLIQHFGLGAASKVDSIIIEWPSGKRQVLTEKSANQKITVVESGSAAVESGENFARPQDYALKANYPNPFNPATTIDYRIPQKTRVTLIIFDANGHYVTTLIDEDKSAGTYSAVWDGRNNRGIMAASGLYFYKMVTTDYESVGKMTLLR